MILFFDTETTGLPDNRLMPDHPSQPHIVQLAMLLAEEDGTERASVNLVVNPGVPIPSRAADVHGITDEVADRCGVPENVAVAMFDRLACLADTIVAHNNRFDLALLNTAWMRCRKETQSFDRAHGGRKHVCTMTLATPLVNLPPTDRMRAAGFDKPKPPKLEECMAHFFSEKLEGAHDALVDVRATARLFFHLKTMGAA